MFCVGFHLTFLSSSGYLYSKLYHLRVKHVLVPLFLPQSSSQEQADLTQLIVVVWVEGFESIVSWCVVQSTSMCVNSCTLSLVDQPIWYLQ